MAPGCPPSSPLPPRRATSARGGRRSGGHSQKWDADLGARDGDAVALESKVASSSARDRIDTFTGTYQLPREARSVSYSNTLARFVADQEADTLANGSPSKPSSAMGSKPRPHSALAGWVDALSVPRPASSPAGWPSASPRYAPISQPTSTRPPTPSDSSLRREVQQLRAALNATVADLMEAQAELALLRPSGADALRRAKEFLTIQGVASSAANGDMPLRLVPLCSAKEFVLSPNNGDTAHNDVQRHAEKEIAGKRKRNLQSQVDQLEAQLTEMRQSFDELKSEYEHLLDLAQHVSTLCWSRRHQKHRGVNHVLFNDLEEKLKVCKIELDEERCAQDVHAFLQRAGELDNGDSSEEDDFGEMTSMGSESNPFGRHASDSAGQRSSVRSSHDLIKRSSTFGKRISQAEQNKNLKRLFQGRVQQLWQRTASVVSRLKTLRGHKLNPDQKFAAVILHDVCKMLAGDVEASRKECPTCLRCWRVPFLNVDDCPECQIPLLKVESAGLGIYEFVSQRVQDEEFGARSHQLVLEAGKETNSPRRSDAGPEESPVEADPASVQPTIEEQMSMNYTKAFEVAGGQDVAERCFKQVSHLIREIKQIRPVGRVSQDVGYATLGLDSLFELCSSSREKLVSEVDRIAEKTDGEYLVPGLKDRVRARSKILTKYSNDSACLTDLLRASICYPGIKEIYNGLKTILEEDLKLNRRDFFVREVEDRFQKSKDGYRDIMLLFEMDGLICEVQLHCKPIMDAKKSGGHKSYRKQRLVNELLFEACMRNYENEVVCLARNHRTCAKGVKDRYSRTALHYACQHGSTTAVRSLMQFSADPWAEDRDGMLPCELALRARHFDTLRLVLMRMWHDKAKDPRVLRRLVEHSLLWWCDHTAHTLADAQTTQSPTGSPTAAFGKARRLSAQPFLLRSGTSMDTNSSASDAGCWSPHVMARLFGSCWTSTGHLLTRIVCRHVDLGGERILDKWLISAASAGETGRVTALLSTGFDVKADIGRASVMDCAIEGGHADLAETLQDIWTYERTDCCTCWLRHVNEHLRDAAKDEDGPRALAALKARADPNDIKSKATAKRTPLMAFCAAGDLEIVAALINCQAQVGYQDAFGNYALHYAKVFGHTSVQEHIESVKKAPDLPMHKLLEQKKDKWHQAKDYVIEAVRAGCCAAHWRVASDQATAQDFAEILRSRLQPHNYTLLHLAVQAVKQNDPAGQVCRSLIMLRADGNAKAKHGETPLHLLAYEGRKDLYDQLLYAIELQEEPVSDALVSTPSTRSRRNLLLHGLTEGALAQDPAELLSRKLAQKDAKERARYEAERGAHKSSADQRILLEGGFMAFKHNMFHARLRQWREESSKTRLDLFRNQRDMLIDPYLERMSENEEALSEDLTFTRARARTASSGAGTTSSAAGTSSGAYTADEGQDDPFCMAEPPSPPRVSSSKARSSALQAKQISKAPDDLEVAYARKKSARFTSFTADADADALSGNSETSPISPRPTESRTSSRSGTSLTVPSTSSTPTASSPGSKKWQKADGALKLLSRTQSNKSRGSPLRKSGQSDISKG